MDEQRVTPPVWFKKRQFSGDTRSYGLPAPSRHWGVVSLDLVCAAPCVAGANQSANQAQTKAQIKFPRTSALLLTVTFGGANHRANQIGCHPRLNPGQVCQFAKGPASDPP